MDTDPEKRKVELDLFFRQYVKVLTYMDDKKHALESKIAAEKFAIAPGDFKSLEDAMDDKTWIETNVYKDEKFTGFYGASLYNSIAVMKTD